MLCLLSGSLATAEPEPVLVPTVSFRADAAGGELFDALQGTGLFAHLSKEAPGAPIQLRIYHSVHPASVDAKNFFSGLLSVGTLGFAPVVMSGEHTLHYELFVNGARVSRHEYTAKLSRNEYQHSKTADTTHGLGPDGVIWAKSTVELFARDFAGDPAVRAVNEEYQVYFAAPKTSHASAAGEGATSAQ